MMRTPRIPLRAGPLRLISALVIAALVVTACAPGDTGVGEDEDIDEPAEDVDIDDPAEEEATGASELRVTVWTGNDAHLALFDEIADSFVAQHDTIESISFDVLPFEDYNDALTVQLAGGNPPDLGWIMERNGPEFVQSGVLHDVGSSLRGTEGYDFDDIEESALELWVDGDSVYGYPFSTSPFALFYNADMYEQAGLQTPDALLEQGEWTWDALRSAATTIVDEDIANHGFVVRDFEFSLWDNLATVWRGWGASAWSEDGTTSTFADPEMVEAMSWFHSMVFEDQAHPGPGQSADFFAGDAALTITQISRASLLEEDGFAWGLVPLPEGPAGAQQVVGQAAVGVFTNSEARPEAMEFLAYWTNEENSRAMAQFFPPPRASLLTAEVLAETNPLLTGEQLERVVIEGIATGGPIPSHPNFAQLRDTIRSELDALWEADADVQSVLEQVRDASEPLLQ